MTDLTQKVKYEVSVKMDDLASLKTALDAAEKAAKDLGTALDKLAGSNVKGMRQLGGTVQALGTRLGKFATVADPAGQAMMRLKTALEAVPPAAAKTDAGVKQVNKALDESVSVTKQVEKEHSRFTMRMLKIYGTFHAIRYTLVNAFAGIREGARQMDLDRILTQQFANFNATIKKTQELTAGTVGRGQLTKSFALMSSFGIPMDQFSENMELVQKMAIRTGQSADFLTDSFARGISRLSPLILDNLGIQVSLADANAEYSAQTGKLTTELTKEERIAALLQHTLGKLKENTRGVSLEADSAAAAVSRLEAVWDDFWLWIKTRGGELIQTIDHSFQSQKQDVKQMAGTLEDVIATTAKLKEAGLMGFVPTEAENTKKALTTLAGTMPGLAERVDQYTESWQDVSRAILYARTIAYELGKKPGAGQSSLADALGFGSVGRYQMAEFGQAMQIILDQQERARIAAESFLSTAGDSLTAEQKRAIVAALYSQAEAQAALALGEAESRHKRVGGQLERALDITRSRLESVSRENNLYTAIAGTLIKLFTSRNDANAANLQQMDAEVARSQQALDAAREMSALKEGQSLAAQALTVTTTKLSAIYSDIAKAEEAFNEARKENRGKEEAAALHKLRIEAERMEGERNFWRERKKVEDEAIKRIKDAGNDAIKAEVARLLVLQAQLFVLEAQAEAIQKAARAASGKMLLSDQQTGAWEGKGPLLPGGAAELGRQIEELLKGLEKGRGREPSTERVREEYMRTKMPVKEKRILYGWNFEDLTAAMGEVNSLYERLVDTATSSAGPIGGGKDPLFGRMTPEKFKEYEAALRGYLEADQAATQRFKQFWGDAFDPNNVEQLNKIKADFEELLEHFDNIANAAKALYTVTDAMRAFGSALREDMFGAGVIEQIGQFADNIDLITSALEKNSSAYGLVTAAIPAMRQFTNALIKDRRAQAGIEAIMQGAAAWAAYAEGNVPKGIAHTAAALLYAGVALKAIRLPSGKSKDSTPRESRGGGGGEAKRPDIHIHIAGNVVQTEAERGVMAQAAIQEARRRGML